VYLAYLCSTIKSLGANVIKSSLPTDQGFPEALKALLRLMDHSNNGKVAAIVNCTGLGAARLCGDTKMFPSRGQTLLVKFSGETPEKKISLYEDEGQNVAYAFPRPGTDVWLFGGTKTRGRWDTKPDDAVSEGILERCCKLLQCTPEDISVVATQVGLRPGRHGGPRVEIEEVDVGDEGVVNVVHEYGHGGAGYQNSIGSAGKVLGLLRGLLGEV
jgi:D-amino-acid oxidase